MINFKDYKVPDKVDIVLPHPTIIPEFNVNDVISHIKSWKKGMNKIESKEWKYKAKELIDQLS